MGSEDMGDPREITAQQTHRADLRQLVAWLASERGDEERYAVLTRNAADDTDALFSLFRDLVNTRPPLPAPMSFLEVQDRMLTACIAIDGTTSADELAFDEDGVSIWRGDITRLEIDGVVNAANSQLLGCWIPGHYCIDNAIHTYAGVQLRLECDRIMKAQGHEEPCGQAKITPAYNLPSTYVLHTVGPIANGHPTKANERQLASCYESCLSLAAQNGLKTLAFCCISTGVFGFPRQKAAHIATSTVRRWLSDNDKVGMRVVFDVFSPEDEELYRQVLDRR